MNTFAAVCGWIVIVALAAVAVCLSASLMFALARKAFEKAYFAIDEKARHELGRSIHASAHWFGECQDTALAIKMLGDRLIRQGSADANEWREAWRGAIKQREARKESAQRT